MDEPTRRRITEYVKPLVVGLDGLANYGDVERIVAASEEIASASASADRDLLFLLAVFSGQEKWVSRMGHRSRTEIFLASLGIPARTIVALFRGLSRFATDPRTPEEEAVHDAVNLDDMGAYGIARHLVEGYRERMDFLQMAGAIEEAADLPLKTEAGEALAAERRETMRGFARSLRMEYEEFGSRRGSAR